MFRPELLEVPMVRSVAISAPGSEVVPTRTVLAVIAAPPLPTPNV